MPKLILDNIAFFKLIFKIKHGITSKDTIVKTLFLIPVCWRMSYRSIYSIDGEPPPG